MKRKFLVGAFLVIVFITCIVLTGLFFVPPMETDDIWFDTMDFVIYIFVLLPIVLAETELYRSCTYFFLESKKSKWKTICNVISILLAGALIFEVCSCFYNLSKWRELAVVLIFCGLVILRILYYILGKMFPKD